MINGWLLYRKHFEEFNSGNKENLRKETCKTLVQFTSEVAQSLIANAREVKKKRGRPSLEDSLNESTNDVNHPQKHRRNAPDILQTPLDIRLDETAHWPIHREDRPRCFLCKEKTRIGCSKCEKGLCLFKDRNCFVAYHNAKV